MVVPERGSVEMGRNEQCRAEGGFKSRLLSLIIALMILASACLPEQGGKVAGQQIDGGDSDRQADVRPGVRTELPLADSVELGSFIPPDVNNIVDFMRGYPVQIDWSDGAMSNTGSGGIVRMTIPGEYQGMEESHHFYIATVDHVIGSANYIDITIGTTDNSVIFRHAVEDAKEISGEGFPEPLRFLELGTAELRLLGLDEVNVSYIPEIFSGIDFGGNRDEQLFIYSGGEQIPVMLSDPAGMQIIMDGVPQNTERLFMGRISDGEVVCQGGSGQLILDGMGRALGFLYAVSVDSNRGNTSDTACSNLFLLIFPGVKSN